MYTDRVVPPIRPNTFILRLVWFGNEIAGVLIHKETCVVDSEGAVTISSDRHDLQYTLTCLRHGRERQH